MRMGRHTNIDFICVRTQKALPLFPNNKNKTIKKERKRHEEEMKNTEKSSKDNKKVT